MRQTKTTVLDSLNRGLMTAMQTDENVMLLGEDIGDPYGGAFRVTQGLATAFPQRVWQTPISEAGITGIAAGMAARGLRPVVEIMFGDFLTLTADQILNHATKFRYMYNDQVQVPLVMRTPMGGRRGYGPTHSQTLEKLFLGMPGLRVIAPFNLAAAGSTPGELLSRIILTTTDPVLFVEHKLQYLLPLMDETDLAEFAMQTHQTTEGLPWYSFQVKNAPQPQVTLAAYGYCAQLALQAILKLAYDAEIFCELLVPIQLSPFALSPLFASLAQTRRLLTFEEGTLTLGWGTEVIARALENDMPLLKASRLAALDSPIPAARHLEDAIIPGVDALIEHIQRMV